MGVVYKARQVGLGRLVAVKVILSGRHSGPQDLARFRQEAETLARLKHPHIVQVYEIHEQEGCPFFSLEFCPGGSLDRRLGGAPVPPAEAAALVGTLARAMHAAHQAGVIHRDLKPANVLLAADGTPRITDFGLAKQVEGGDHLTQSGSILGTPGYMAPEQAAGRSGLVTTAADVYALGAILYECLTGRPPFRAGTAFDTILQVLEREPERPSAVRPGIDRGLELICLKCLAKDPARRYGSADALAAELDRWRAGEPVSVQPPALAALLRVWLRQNFGAAGWTVVVGLAVGLTSSLLLWLTAIQPTLKGLEPSYRRATGDAPWLVSAWALPPWLGAPLNVLGIAAIGFSGLATARLVRPRNGQGDVAAGLVSGTVAGVVFFTLTLGWLATLLQMRPVIRQDLGWLSAAAWGAPAGRERLLEKYPDLLAVPLNDRGRVLAGKVAGDLLTGMPRAILLGMFLSLGCCIAFGVCSASMGGRLLRERGGMWKAVLPYMEGVIPLALLCGAVSVLLVPWLLGGRYNLPLWYLLLLPAVLGLAVAGVLRGWHWAARLLPHAAWVLLLVAQPWLELR
jgi:hypothetical protein